MLQAMSQEIINDTRRHYVQIRWIMDEGHDFVRHCNDELSQSGPDNFSLPHGSLLNVFSLSGF
jgi:hypothetical protein